MKAKPHVCQHPGCAFTGLKSTHLKVHMRIHTNERPFVCGTADCTYAARTPTALRVHQRAVHQAEGALPCPHCRFLAAIPRVLKEHIDAHEDTKPHVCGACGYGTSYKSHLLVHARSCGVKPKRRRLLLVRAERGNEDL